jgi:hypothetical protein
VEDVFGKREIKHQNRSNREDARGSEGGRRPSRAHRKLYTLRKAFTPTNLKLYTQGTKIYTQRAKISPTETSKFNGFHV